MRVRAIGPSVVPPYVPNYVVLDDGRVLFGDGTTASEGPADGNDFQLPSVIEVPDGSWVGVCSDGTLEVFKRSEEGPWRAKQAETCVKMAHEMARTEPLKSVEMLKSAANLVGLNIPLLVQSLEMRRADGESLADTFDRIRKASS